ncbi:MAG: alpha/beta hydrolase [Paludibacter sp.]
MKKITFFLLLLFCTVVVSAQKKQPKDTTRYEYRTEKSIPYRDANLDKLDEYGIKNCQLDFYYPVNKKAFATLVWIHGGSLKGGKKEIPEKLMNQGFAVVSIDYRLHPKVNCPVYIEDAAAAVAWTFRNVVKYGGDSTKIFLSGHSAGGYLDLMVGMDKKWLAKYNIDPNRIAGLLPLSPQTITHFTIRKERGIRDTQPIIDEYAPLFHVRNDLPPLVLITGDRELEMLGRYEENAYLARMMKLNGHTQTQLFELQGFGHGPMMQPGIYLLIAQLNKLIGK